MADSVFGPMVERCEAVANSWTSGYSAPKELIVGHLQDVKRFLPASLGDDSSGIAMHLLSALEASLTLIYHLDSARKRQEVTDDGAGTTP